MSTPNIKTIIFDFGNVVGYFDFGRTFEKIMPHTDYSEAEIRKRLTTSGLADPYETGQMSSEEFLVEMKKLLGLRCDQEFAKSAWMDIFEPNPSVCELIPRLKSRYRIQLGSNTNDLHAQQFCEQFAETLAHFDALTLSHEVGARKPDARFYEHGVELANCRPEECVFIDDLAENIEGANACGLHGIHYTEHTVLERRFQELGIIV